MRFQVLIGRLVTDHLILGDGCSRSLFQVLIGRLVTRKPHESEHKVCEFQVLIGRLVTAVALLSGGTNTGFKSL